MWVGSLPTPLLPIPQLTSRAEAEQICVFCVVSLPVRRETLIMNSYSGNTGQGVISYTLKNINPIRAEAGLLLPGCKQGAVQELVPELQGDGTGCPWPWLWGTVGRCRMAQLCHRESRKQVAMCQSGRKCRLVFQRECLCFSISLAWSVQVVRAGTGILSMTAGKQLSVWSKHLEKGFLQCSCETLEGFYSSSCAFCLHNREFYKKGSHTVPVVDAYETRQPYPSAHGGQKYSHDHAMSGTSNCFSDWAPVPVFCWQKLSRSITQSVLY